MSLRFEDFEIPSAKLGKLNPLPDLSANQDTHANIAIDEETVSPEESKYMGWAKVNSILPYMIQDGYDRKKKPKQWHAANSRKRFYQGGIPASTGRPSLVAVRQKGRPRTAAPQPCIPALQPGAAQCVVLGRR